VAADDPRVADSIEETAPGGAKFPGFVGIVLPACFTDPISGRR
jgi:hypothetical protein